MKTTQKKQGLGKQLGMLLLCGTMIASATPLGAGAVSQVEATLRPDITIVIDGSERTFYNASAQEAHPIVYNGTTYLPVRAIGELMGKNVDWNQSTLTVTLGGKRTTAAVSGTPDSKAKIQTVSAQVRDDFTIVVDGTQRSFADVNGKRVYPLLYNGSNYLPLRAVGELMGKRVSWDGKTDTVTLTGDSLVTDADSFSGGDASKPQVPQTGTEGLISAGDAKAKALAHAGLTASQVTMVQNKLEWEDGRQVYDVEFYTADRQEYDYEIDAVTGEVIRFDYDAEHGRSTATEDDIITREEATAAALAKVPGATAANVVKVKLDYDDGRAEYDVEIIYNGMEYEFEIDAVAGTILSWESEPADRK